MNSRRNFLAKTSIAATALMVPKPFSTFSNSFVGRSFGFGNNNNRLVLLHTGNNAAHHTYAEQKIAFLRKNSHNLLLLKHNNEDLSESNYEIVYKNNIKTGIIKAIEGDNPSVINERAAYLKKEKACQLVICLSNLGYKNISSLDDLTVAEKSSHIDFIIGNHVTNHTPFPIVARNSILGEVIIHHAANNGFGLGNIEVEFDEKTNTKKFLAINNLLTRLPKSA